MRIDKFLQVSRIIKRRTVAKEIVAKDRVLINDRTAKAGSQLKVGDEITIKFGDTTLIIKVLLLNEKVKKEDAGELYEIISKI